MKIATVPIGYADGFIRQNAKDGYMLVNGKKQKLWAEYVWTRL